MLMLFRQSSPSKSTELCCVTAENLFSYRTDGSQGCWTCQEKSHCCSVLILLIPAGSQIFKDFRKVKIPE